MSSSVWNAAPATPPGWPTSERERALAMSIPVLIVVALLFFMRKLTGKETDAPSTEVATRD